MGNTSLESPSLQISVGILSHTFSLLLSPSSPSGGAGLYLVRPTGPNGSQCAGRESRTGDPSERPVHSSRSPLTILLSCQLSWPRFCASGLHFHPLSPKTKWEQERFCTSSVPALIGNSALSYIVLVKHWHFVRVHCPGQKVCELLVPPRLSPISRCPILVQCHKVGCPLLSIVLVLQGGICVIPVLLEGFLEDTLLGECRLRMKINH